MSLLREGQAPGNQVYPAPLGGVGLPSRKSLKTPRGQFVVGSSAKNNLGRERRDSARHPRPCCNTDEGASSALPEAPVQGQPGHRSALHVRTPRQPKASSSADTTHCPRHPSLPDSWAQTLGVLFDCLPSLCLPVSFPLPLPSQHSFSSTLPSQALARWETQGKIYSTWVPS